MRLFWLPASRRDLMRLHAFLKVVNPLAARRRIEAICTAVARLPDNPRVGHTVETYAPREVRSYFVSDYEVHYEILEDAIAVLRIWHMREDR